jgi:hypothetical protein
MVSKRELGIILGTTAGVAVGIALAAKRVMAAPPPPGYEYVLIGTHKSSFTLDPLYQVGTVLEHQSDPTGGWEWVRLRSDRMLSEVKQAWEACSDAWYKDRAILRVAGPPVAQDLYNYMAGKIGTSSRHMFQRGPSFYENMLDILPWCQVQIPGEFEVSKPNQMVWGVDLPEPPALNVRHYSRLRFVSDMSGTVRRKLVLYDSRGQVHSYGLDAEDVSSSYKDYSYGTGSFPYPMVLVRAELYDNGSDYYPWRTESNFLIFEFGIPPVREYLEWVLERIRELLDSILKNWVPPPEYQVQVDTNPGVFLSL